MIPQVVFLSFEHPIFQEPPPKLDSTEQEIKIGRCRWVHTSVKAKLLQISGRTELHKNRKILISTAIEKRISAAFSQHAVRRTFWIFFTFILLRLICMIRRGYGPFNTNFCYFFNIGRFFFKHSKNKDKLLRDLTRCAITKSYWGSAKYSVIIND